MAAEFLMGMRAGLAQDAPCLKDGRGLILKLKRKYKETDLGGGQVNPSRVLRLFAAPDGKTFTILSLSIDGSACILAAGHDLEIVPPRPTNEKES